MDAAAIAYEADRGLNILLLYNNDCIHKRQTVIINLYEWFSDAAPRVLIFYTNELNIELASLAQVVLQVTPPRARHC